LPTSVKSAKLYLRLNDDDFKMDQNKIFTDAVRFFGTQKKLAEACGVSMPAVTLWKRDGIPVTRMYQIEILTNGAVKACKAKAKRK
jgi:DNA-binding transcriptional regulator YdaS (Cro superfamily)